MVSKPVIMAVAMRKSTVNYCTLSAPLKRTGCCGTVTTLPLTFTFPAVIRSSALLLDAMPALAIT